MMNKILITLCILSAPASYAACELNDGGNKTPFSGGSLDGVQVEKKSLPALNKEFPTLNATEKAFKGELQTCSSCSGKYVTCN